MDRKLIAATDQGIVTLAEVDQKVEAVSRSFQDQQFTAVAVSPAGAVLAGTHNGLYLSLDSGQTWREANSGLGQTHIRSLAFHPERPEFAYAGTEPAAIYYSRDGGRNWNESPDVPRYREQNNWFLPYSPEAGCIRGFSFSEQVGYAAVEVGGMLVSHDFGEHWTLTQELNTLRPNEQDIHSDVHRVYIHPESSQTVIAPTGGGLYISEDGAETWDLLNPNYCRAAWSAESDWNEIVFGPADGPDRNGRIVRTTDGGSDWHPVDEGLDPPWGRTMVEHIIPVDGDLYVILSNGRLISSTIGEFVWETVLPAAYGVRGLSALVEADEIK